MAVRFESQAEPIAGYRLLERLGSGGFGEVWKAEAPGGIYKAIKIIHGDLRNRETDTYRFAEQELKSLKRVKQVRHPYLLALDRYDIVEGRLMITMELADCNLWDRFRQCRKQGLPGIPREELLRYMMETAEVLDLFNDRFQLQHLDIKPQNLFLLYDHVKVADFGQVKDLEGIMATVTGGITPVYAAPETFDGFVSRYCDQYSLACVYQELLTGQRPFDGTSMQQLLMQHLQMPPNLQPSPPSDRGPMARALSKKPDDRYPNVMAFVKALQLGDSGAKSSVNGVPVPAAPFLPSNLSPLEAQASDQIRVSWTSSAPAAAPVPEPSTASVTGFSIPSPSQVSGGSMPDLTPMPSGVFETSVPQDRQAPPEQIGPGSIRPALIIGLGYTGQRTLQRLHKQLLDRFGSGAITPSVRFLYLDTDPDALQAAQSDQPWEGLAALPTECLFPAKLNRASHYMKNQINGRTQLEEWFDPQLLYRLPRIPVTTGLRMLGRLAFYDHYRNLHQRLTTELELCLDPANLSETLNNTGLELATNRPRVYIVAGLGGGTGSGIFLDLAYAVRYRLKRLGYSEPDVVGLLTVPPDGPPTEVTPLAQANTYAALTELHHFSRDDSSYTINFDERIGGLRDYGAPFTEVYILPGYPSPPPSNAAPSTNNGSPTSSGVIRVQGPRAMNGSGSANWTNPGRRSTSQLPSSGRTPRSGGIDLTTDDPTTPLSDFLRLELFDGVGRQLQANRPPARSLAAGVIRTFGACKFTWPRAEVIDRVARIVAPVLLGQWVTPDSDHSRSVVPSWVQEQWVKMKLEPEKLGQLLLQEVKRRLGFDFELVVEDLARTLNPRGWLQRLPDPEQVAITLAKWQALIGRPKPPANLEPSQLEEALVESLIELMPSFQSDLPTVFSSLVEHSRFRLPARRKPLGKCTVNSTGVKSGK